MHPPIVLDPDSGVPLYRQLYTQLKDSITSGRILKGEKLPATRELAGLLGLNRATVAAAYQLLEEDGLLKGHVGRGSFVDGPAAASGRVSWDRIVSPPCFPPMPALSLSPAGISFASSRPADELFPMEDFRLSCEEVIHSEQAAQILQLGSPYGYAPLRHYLFEQARRRGDARESDDVVITNGCQQALDLLQRVLVHPEDTVILEDPVYPGLRNVFAAAGARLVGIPVGPQGIDLDRLEQALTRERPRLVVVTPDFQNPTGATLPLSARHHLLRLVRQSGAILIEIVIYGALRYEGEALPTLKQLDPAGDVILLDSFSKLAFPGLRVGWMIAPKAVALRVVEAKQWCDLHSDQLSQAVLFRFAETGRLAEHRKKVLAAGAKRLAAVLAACEKHLPAGSTFTRPQGGMNLWVRLPEPLDAAELLPRVERARVNYLPGKYFAVSRVETGALRLSFAGLTPERIRAGVAVLGEVFSKELERALAAQPSEPAAALV